ncbi:MAG: sigma-70 family RNA polymerase sigma factor [Planctomycetes bacterium]|nr:sigma-70 family RNA polymerase sigma factor [Planctomycetota bacterium]
MIDPQVEASLVARLKSDDGRVRAAAKTEAFNRLGEPVFQLCLRVTCDPADAEDARQEAFVDILRALSSFRGEARFSTWVFRVALRAATRVRSRRRRHDESRVDWTELTNEPGSSAVGDESRGQEDPSRELERREGALRLLAAISRLPFAQRAVLALAALEDVPRAEIAAVLGIPLGTVDSRLNAARESLRRELE